jgi:hypothetical protein
MKSLVVGGLLLGAAVLAGPVHAAELDLSACTFSQAPTVPDGSAATEQQMIDASAAVKAYVAETEKGLACLEEAKKKLGEEPMTEEQQANYNGLWNGAVDSMQAAATAFNEAVRAYKAKNPG